MQDVVLLGHDAWSPPVGDARTRPEDVLPLTSGARLHSSRTWSGTTYLIHNGQARRDIALTSSPFGATLLGADRVGWLPFPGHCSRGGYG